MAPFRLLHHGILGWQVTAGFGFQDKEIHLGEDSKSDLFSFTDQGDKNSALMNQEVLTLQEMLNSLDFKRKASEEL